MTNINRIQAARDTAVNPSGLMQLGFLNVTSELLLERIAEEQSSLAAMKQELALMENASLCIRSRRDQVWFSSRSRDTGRETGISHDRPRVQRLARRAFLEQQMKSSRRRIDSLQKILDRAADAGERQCFQARLQRYEDAGLDLCSILFTPEQIDWINRPFSPNPFYPEDLKYPTEGSLLMRSKSEARLGSALESIGLPYRYDDLVSIQYDPRREKPSRDSYFADFKIPNLAGGITVHEHLGAFQVNRYGEGALIRLNDYHRFQIYELENRPVRHEEITWSFEHDLQDQKLFRALIRRMLLPGI